MMWVQVLPPAKIKKKVLTSRKVCDIIKTQRGKQGKSRRQDPRELCKSLMTKSSTARCVGLRNTNVNQCRLAEEMTDYAYYKANTYTSEVINLQGCFCRGVHECRTPNFYYNTRLAICQVKCLEKIHKIILPFLYNITACFLGVDVLL